MDESKLHDCIEEAVIAIQEIFRKNYDANNHPMSLRDSVGMEVLSKKWARIFRFRWVNGPDGLKADAMSVYAFIALQDFETKALGPIRAGDIHRPAGWKAPAKHARGTVFNRETWTCFGPYGVAYLRG